MRCLGLSGAHRLPHQFPCTTTSLYKETLQTLCPGCSSGRTHKAISLGRSVHPPPLQKQVCFTHPYPFPVLQIPECSLRAGPRNQKVGAGPVLCAPPHLWTLLGEERSLGPSGARDLPPLPEPRWGSQVWTLGTTREASWLGLGLLAQEGGEANTARPELRFGDGTVPLGASQGCLAPYLSSQVPKGKADASRLSQPQLERETP